MNYDLFIPPQILERTPPVPPAATAREAPAGTRKGTPRSAMMEVADFADFGLGTHEEVSSDERTTGTVRHAVEMINRMLDRSPVDLNLSIDDGTGSLVIKLIERQSRKVIRQIPPDEILRLRRHLQELLGVIFDETA
jgi:flagellar protein FlaG